MNPFDIMKNAKEIQAKIANIKSDLDQEVVEGVSGGGLVKIRLKGSFEVESIFLDPIAVDNRDVPMLQDLIRAAHNDAVAKLKELLQNKLGPLASLAGGLPF
ncbi:YbaB/EbfC family nucleoid-associated protein [Treponema denticola]|uniref:Nucleoid-associated protein HMPREF9733_02289 n=1 Tax=Treponema denticola SP33 TaxID=999437 RepID=M2BAD6_TREDN|nr:YbaB/EbfC family nucleoid-associated protein [Treponema denticola]EMB21952.1 YbaB/EbfC family DNA-binding protein [Treponema denticola SP33]EPF35927.1 YbaB/EbfC family DNA-binding protein [Treponema denticola SP32]UTD12508.1 YbaB/EbfC family nucleoid-associated protein [Treponema denticola]UTY24022.1 YbaB/EbfC family nucleoid-associated protein [Treponema denticola]